MILFSVFFDEQIFLLTDP